MLAKAQEVLQSDNLTGLGDAGYYDGEQLKTCEEQGIQVYVAIPDKSKAIAKQGRYTRDQFRYDAELNTYTCPQNQTLTPSGNQQKNGKTLPATKAKPPIAAHANLPTTV
ncbi:hypothetical protein BCS42_00345 [Crenothrix sp. D3]|nr:hypothetical protein BCS42_00345 [Crenothrix sp. D3]